ncbi:hypothetical protein P43SY_000575 [Pythium insidiosum]|uniref:Uncharacterized protein n=1 Tax=Pythium insidiosum TaxID=114742 RepID=A0AAD5LD18_PYTIN|nr:hypothetical protein P43SY_000575 [Pythium insidiosum]
MKTVGVVCGALAAFALCTSIQGVTADQSNLIRREADVPAPVQEATGTVEKAKTASDKEQHEWGWGGGWGRPGWGGGWGRPGWGWGGGWGRPGWGGGWGRPGWGWGGGWGRPGWGW